MEENKKPLTILMADDDEDDCFMAEEALQEAGLDNEIRFVRDGEELMEYLYHQGQYSDRERFPRPGMILLDLNMPKKDGREALKEIKSDPDLRLIPVVVLTTSKAEDDIFSTYTLGANSFITKPVTFKGLVDIMKTMNIYWFNTVKLPNRD